MRKLALLFALALAAAPLAQATELPHNAPTHTEQELLDTLGNTSKPDTTRGFVHIEDQRARVLVQPPGRIWRDLHEYGQFWADAALITIAVLAMAALYAFAGSMHYHPDPMGRRVKRFNVLERFSHWLTASTFIVLAVTGLNLVFGRWLLQPVIGDGAFYELTHLGKLAHNFIAFPFILGLAMNTVQWLRPNLPDRTDLTWIKMAGGMFGGPHPPARKFNAGQKMIYWISVFGGGALIVSGLLLMLPFSFYGILGMQATQLAHSLVAALMVAVIIGHVYLGTVGVRGSFDAMSTGTVDLNWAREHHPLWVEEEVAKGRLASDLKPAE